MEKILFPGTVPHGKHRVSVFCKITFEDGRLSISGVVNPTKSGNADSAGQILDTFLQDDFQPAKNWTPAMIGKFYHYWKTWHLNDLYAACVHQRTLGWTYEKNKGQKCPTCNYEIGTAWKYEPLPDHVISFLYSLPESKRVPAWV